MSDIKPDEPCPCHSGFLYADCHMALNEAPPDKVLGIAHKQYVDRWEVNSEFYDGQGIYAMLARHLSYHITPSRILDIGCGHGQGLSALLEKFKTPIKEIIAIDDNLECLNAAASRLNLPYPKPRLQWSSAGGKNYDLAIIPNLLTSSQGVTLLHSDIWRPDAELDDLIKSKGSLDAVTLWFSGTHGARQFDIMTHSQDLNSSAQIRMATEVAAVETAQHFGKKGSVFHLVNRGAERNEKICKVLINSTMEELAKRTGITLSSLTLFPYSEPSTEKRIAVGSPGEDLSGMKNFVCSAIFRL